MLNNRSFPNPLRFYFNHSQLLAPARNLYRQAEDWTDYACVIGYLVFLAAMLYWAATTFSMSFLIGLGGFAITVILIRLGCQYLL